MKKRVKSDERNTTDPNFLKSKILTLLTFLCLIGLVVGVNAVSVVSDDLIYVNESSRDDSNNINIDPNDTVIDTEDPIPIMNSDALTVIYVDESRGSDSNDGSTRDKAKKTIKNAVNNVAAGGTIHIADGTYTGSDNKSIIITKNVNIIGDSQKGTIIDAKRMGFFDTNGKIFIVKEGVTANIQNLTLTHVSWGGCGGAISNDHSNCIVSGCTFIENKASGGGAIFNYNGSLTVNNSTFTNNIGEGPAGYRGYGGAIYSEDGSLTVKNSTFSGNTADYGGAISNGHSNCIVSGCTFIENKASGGGAIFDYNGSLTVNNSTFTNNIGEGPVGYRGDGGAIYSEDGSLTVKNSTFSGNTADYGGAIYGHGKSRVEVETSVFTNNRVNYHGGAIHNDASVTVRDSTFSNNFACGNGGAVYNHDGPITVECSVFCGNIVLDKGGAVCKDYGSGSVTVKESTFKGNGANRNGGAVYNHDGSITVNDSTFTDNYAYWDGGAICKDYGSGSVNVDGSSFDGNNAVGHGGAVYSKGDKSYITVNGSAFNDNTADYGGAICKNDAYSSGASVVLKDSTFTGNSVKNNGGAVCSDGYVTVDGSSFNGNSAFKGGAILGGASVTMVNSVFTGNKALSTDGGAVYTIGFVNVDGSTFKGNSAVKEGGAIRNANGPATLKNSTFAGNIATKGGGIISDGAVTVYGSTFHDNTASGDGGAIHKHAGGHVYVNGSTFTGNMANTGSAEGGSGGAIYNPEGSLSVSGSTFTGNKANAYGGTIYNSGALSVKDSIFTNNTANSGAGGAICHGNRGSLSVSGSTFTGNKANAYGGAIFNPEGSLSVNGSTFKNNTADTAGLYSGGGAIYNGGSLSVSGSTFTDNTASNGGAILTLNSLGDGEVHYNRIVGNTASNGPDICSYSGSVNAANNWWGSNDNPSNRVSSNVNVGPWLVLSIKSDPARIPDGGNSTITADLLHNSNKASVNGPVPDGVPVTFSSTNGTIDPESGDLVKGKATSVFTAGNQGTGNVVAVVDNQTVSTQIVIRNEFPVVYVDGFRGSDSNDGSSPEKAKKTIEDAIDTAADGGKVRVADGTYEGLGNTNIPITRGVSIIGNSQSGTVINAEGSGRVFTVDKGVNVVIQDLTLTGGNTDHGGAVYNDKGSLTIKDSTLVDNTAGDGGAVYNNGSLSISGSILTDNHVTGHGGAVYSNGSLTVDNSTLTGNLASQNGGAIHNIGSLSVSGSILTGNVARNGGAISSGSAGEVHFNRIIGNTASTGKDIYSPTASVNAANNWWGSNDNPSNRVFGNVNVDPWIVLTVKADPTSISVGDNSTITADLLHNSNNESVSGPVPDGIPVVFSASNGTLNSKSGILVKGKATSVFTAGNPGTANIMVTVDSQVVSTQVIINELLTQVGVNMTDVPEFADLNATRGNSSSLRNKSVVLSGGMFGYN